MHLGAAIGTMNFTRTLDGHDPGRHFRRDRACRRAARADRGDGRRQRAGTSVATRSLDVFMAAAGTLTVAFVAMLLLEEKPLLEALPRSRA